MAISSLPVKIAVGWLSASRAAPRDAGLEGSQRLHRIARLELKPVLLQAGHKSLTSRVGGPERRRTRDVGDALVSRARQGASAASAAPTSSWVTSMLCGSDSDTEGDAAA